MNIRRQLKAVQKEAQEQTEQTAQILKLTQQLTWLLAQRLPSLQQEQEQEQELAKAIKNLGSYNKAANVSQLVYNVNKYIPAIYAPIVRELIANGIEIAQGDIK